MSQTTQTTQTTGTNDTSSKPRGMSLARRISELGEQFGIKPEQFVILRDERIVLSYQGVVALCSRIGAEAPQPHCFRTRDDTPETWAPVNRPGYLTDAADRYRNELHTAPETLTDAIGQLHLALEVYEHAQELAVASAKAFYDLAAGEDVVRESIIAALTGSTTRDPATVIDCGGLTASSRSGAEKVLDATPAMQAFLRHKRDLAERKALDEKELSVARRRHATALATVNALAIRGEQPVTVMNMDLKLDGDADVALVAAAVRGEIRRHSTAAAQRAPNAAQGDTEKGC